MGPFFSDSLPNIIIMRYLIAFLFLVGLAPFLSTSELHAFAPDSVSGIVFFDEDGDGTPGSTEAAATNAVVNIQEVGSDFIASMITDEFGYFNTGDIEYGTYHIWTEVGGVSSEITTIEINDVHGTAIVNLPISNPFKIMLPFISY